jgi:hypothetical protein
MPAVPQHFQVRLTQAQRKVVAEIAPELADPLDGDSLQVMQQLYFDQMKSVVNEDQLVALRAR